MLLFFYHKGCLDCEGTMNNCCFEHDCKCYSCKCSCDEEDNDEIESDTEANVRCSYCYLIDCLDCECTMNYCCYKRNWKCSSCKCRKKEKDNVLNINESNARCSCCYHIDCLDCECAMNDCRRKCNWKWSSCRCEKIDCVQDEAGSETNNPGQDEAGSETNNPGQDKAGSKTKDRCRAFLRGANNLISCPFPVHHLVCELAYMSAANVIECCNNKCVKKEDSGQYSDEHSQLIPTDSNVQNCNDKKEPPCENYVLSLFS